MLQKTIKVSADSWVNANTYGESFPADKSYYIQNQSTKSFYLQQSVSSPSESDFTGEVITNLTKRESSKIITPEDDSSELWVRNVKEGEGQISLYMKEWDYSGELGRWYWNANGLSYGVTTIAELGVGSTFSLGVFVEATTGVDQYIIDGDSSTDGAYLFVDGVGGLYFNTSVMSVKVNGDTITQGYLIPLYQEVSVVVDILGACSLHTLACKNDNTSTLIGFITRLSIADITNLYAYPSGSAAWGLDTYAPDNDYVFEDSDNSFPELVTNGDFSEGVNGWSGNGNPSLDPSGGMQVHSSGGNQGVGSTSIPTVAGNTYMIRTNIIIGVGATNPDLRVGTSEGASDIVRVNPARLPYEDIITFVAEGTEAYIAYYHNGSAQDGDYFVVKYASLRQFTGVQLYNASPEDFFEELPS